MPEGLGKGVFFEIVWKYGVEEVSNSEARAW